MSEVTTGSPAETKKVAALVANSVCPPVVIALEGELGAGKTTFVQGFARGLGVKEKIQSPTFVLLKIYKINPALARKSGVKKGVARHLVHIDCYRIDSPQDLLHLGFKNLLKDKDAIILIEWAERIKKLLPRDAIRIKFRHGKKPHERVIDFKRLATSG